MNFDHWKNALQRLTNVLYHSNSTDMAIGLIKQMPSEKALMDMLKLPKFAPGVLEAFCALQSSSEEIFAAVCHAIQGSPCMSWCLIDSLNRLPWYNGIRAFLTLPGLPTHSPCAYPFYILARNKIFPSTMSGSAYQYHYDGLWELLSVAKSGKWQSPPDAASAVVDLIHKHLMDPTPDYFIIYFLALVLGQFAPLMLNIPILESKLGENCDLTVKSAVARTLAYLDDDDTDNADPVNFVKGTVPNRPVSWA